MLKGTEKPGAFSGEYGYLEVDYFLVFKPYGMLCQFTREHGRRSLSDLDHRFPADVYPVGRLDADSEGMILLTNDKRLNRQLLRPENKVEKTYCVLLDGTLDRSSLIRLEKDMLISVNGKKHPCRFLSVKAIAGPEIHPEITLPITPRQPDKLSWVEVKLSEGKNRQVRRMTAACGLPALRVFRSAIGKLRWKGEPMGTVRPISLPLILKLCR